MREIRKAVDARVAEFKPILDHVAVLTPSESIVTVLDVGTSRRMPFHRLISREVVNGVYVDGAYFYVFKPGKYIAA